MRRETGFQPQRLYLLVRNSLVLNRNGIMVAAAALMGVLLLVSLADAFVNCGLTFHRNLFLIGYFPVGLWLTTRAYKTLHDPVRGIAWLLIPASALEKTVSRILLVTLIYTAGSLMGYSMFSVLSEGLNTVIAHRTHPLFNPLDPLVLRSLPTFISIQAPFMIGAVYFRRHTLSKTILALICFFFLFGSGILTAAWFIFGDHMTGLNVRALISTIMRTDFTPAALALKLMFWVAFPAFSWLVCHVRLKETER